MSQDKKQTDPNVLIKRYREALEKIAQHDGINLHTVPSPILAKIAKDALTPPGSPR